jgi:hypothetical protein
MNSIMGGTNELLSGAVCGILLQPMSAPQPALSELAPRLVQRRIRGERRMSFSALYPECACAQLRDADNAGMISHEGYERTR